MSEEQKLRMIVGQLAGVEVKRSFEENETTRDKHAHFS